MNRYLQAGIGVLVFAAALPALASGKKEGTGAEGGAAIAPIDSNLAGPREMVYPPPQASESQGNVAVSATMMAGAGAGKCRMNFIIENPTTVTVALGMIATTVNAKDEVVDNWVVNVGALPPRGQTVRLFSCSLGAVQFSMKPTSEFTWPPVRCVNAAGEAEPCALGLKVTATLPIVERTEKKPDKDEKKK